jgi:peptidoglycan/xylan/chitin deacetylase (PgdA/CDA1 family)
MEIRVTNFLLLLFALNSANAQPKTDVAAEICNWYQNRPGAISLTFDDASYSQFAYAFPILEKYKVKATFSLVGEWTHDEPSLSSEAACFKIEKMGWDAVGLLYKNGHEIAAHGYKHERYNRLLPKTLLIEQMKKVKDLIENKIQEQVFTLHYPYSFTSDKICSAAKEAGYLFCRTGSGPINQSSPTNMNLLNSQVVLNNQNPDSVQLKAWLNEAKGKWLILMYHHLFPKRSKESELYNYHKVKNTYSVFPENFEKQVQIMLQSKYWIAPLANIGKYIVERDNTKLTIKKSSNSLKIKTSNQLDPLQYNQALSVKVNLPWEKVSVEGSENDGIFKPLNQELILNLLPGKTLSIKKLN